MLVYEAKLEENFFFYRKDDFLRVFHDLSFHPPKKNQFFLEDEKKTVVYANLRVEFLILFYGKLQLYFTPFLHVITDLKAQL